MSTDQRWRQLLNPALANITAYSVEAGEYRARLDANEAPNLLSDAARRKLGDVASQIEWRNYPDATNTRLREVVAAHSGVTPPEVLVGVGSDEVISMLLRAFARESKSGSYVLTLTPTFVMYRLAARTQGHQVVEVPLDAGWNMNLESVLKAIDMCHPTLIFVASPNNPTGTMPDEAALARVIEHAADALVVIDEAYIDYAARNHFALLRKYENVIILRTLSKVGFAALRLGWMMAAPEIVHEVNKVRLPFNMPTPTQALATLALSELGDELRAIRAHVLGERERVAARLSEMRGVTVTPSEANFLWITCERPAEEVWEGLKTRGVLVRSFHKSGGRLKQCVRVTIGLAPENDLFLSALTEVL